MIKTGEFCLKQLTQEVPSFRKKLEAETSFMVEYQGASPKEPQNARAKGNLPRFLAPLLESSSPTADRQQKAPHHEA